MSITIYHAMKFRHTTVGAAVGVALIVVPRLLAQDVIVGEPGWFQASGAPDQPPQPKRRPRVDYPDVLLTSDESSYVILARFLDDKGHGLMMEVHSTHPWFKRAVEEAVGDWPMTPAKRGGKAVNSWFWVPVIFNPASSAPKRPDAKPRLLAVTPVIIPEAMMIKLRDNTAAWGTVSLDAAGGPQRVALEPPASDKLLPFVDAALKQWRFAPARKGGQPVAADFRVAFHFFHAMAPVPSKAIPPRVVRQERPIYPFALRKSGIVGEVLVGFVVDTKGDVVNAIAIRSNSPGFNEAAVQAVRKWKFKPAMVDGRPVNTRMSVPIVFSFNDGSGGSEQVTVKSPGRRAREEMPEEMRYDVAPNPRGVVQPVYPYALLEAGTSGEATVLFQIDLEGRIVAAKVVDATHPEFGLALVAAVELYKFDPALKDGKPTTTVLKTKQDFSPSALLSNADRSLLRREKKDPGSIIDAAKLDKPLRPLLQPSPVIPLALRGMVEQGAVTIETLVDEEGHTHLPRIVEASDPAVAYAAVQAVSQWLFEPPKVGGKSTVARLRVPFEFETKPPVMGTAVGIPPAAADGE